MKPLKVEATGQTSIDGQINVDPEQRKSFKILQTFDHVSYYDVFAERLADEKQSAVIGSFNEQKKIWRTRQS